jgi:hypothetical protein
MVVLARRLSSVFGLRKYQKIKWSVSRIIDPKNIPKNAANIWVLGDLIITKKMAIKKNKTKDASRW